MKFFKILEPLAIGNLQIRNRIVIPAMHLNYADEGFVNDQIIEFYRRRAEGGVGLIIVGGIGVEKRGQGVPMMISIEEDKYIPELHKMTDAIHKEGAKVVAQLYHAGAYAYQKLTGEQAVSSSAVFSRFTHETPRELSIDEILELEEKFIKAANRAIQAGFDGIELLSSAGYLLDQFLSPIKNLRTDRYGGKTLEERMTFPLELIDKLKSAVGSKLIIGCRLSGDDFVPGSNTYHEKIQVAKTYAAHGVQYFNVTGGWHETRVPQIPMDTPKAAFSYLAKEIHRSVEVPVFSSNRINEPEVAERLLQDGFADAVCIGRGLIADPDFPKKVAANRVHEIRKCVGCNQGCFDSVFRLEPIKCMVNPYAGFELKYTKQKPVTSKLKVYIVGGGPAGLEAAITAKLNGHDVTLFEKSDQLGGQINAAWQPPGREELLNIIHYYQTQLEQLKIPYFLHSDKTAEQLLADKPDVIFLATGVKFKVPPIKGIDGSQGSPICFADDALVGDYPVGQKVVIIGAAATGVETAIWAAKRGSMDPEVARFLSFYDALPAEEAMKRTYRGDKEVILIEIMDKIATSVGKSTRWVFIQELEKLGISIYTETRVQEFNQHSITFMKDGKTATIDNVDTFILATGVDSNRDLESKLKDVIKQQNIEKPPEIILLGDAKKVGTILDAVHSGFKAAYRLGQFNP
jgi:2,4-dienoyl-CoA reductase (NADPH2)